MTPIVEVEGVERSFGGTRALCGLDLAVPEGQVVALLGPNGAGKTTLVRILSTLIPPDAGTRAIAGFDVVKQPTAVRRVDRPCRAERCRRRHADRAREPRDDRPAVAPFEVGGKGTRAGSARAGVAHGRRRSPAQDVLRRHAQAHRPRSRPGCPPPSAPARRTDHRPRPREPDRPVGVPARARRGRGEHPAHHAVPRGGRPTRQPDRGHRPRRV